MDSCKSCEKYINAGNSYCSSCSTSLPGTYKRPLDNESQIDDTSKGYKQAFTKINKSEYKNKTNYTNKSISSSTSPSTSQGQSDSTSEEDDDSVEWVDGSTNLRWPIVTFVVGIALYAMGVEQAGKIVVISFFWFIILLFKK